MASETSVTVPEILAVESYRIYFYVSDQTLKNSDILRAPLH
jgi:hypothetical protein